METEGVWAETKPKWRRIWGLWVESQELLSQFPGPLVPRTPAGSLQCPGLKHEQTRWSQ